MSHFWRRARRNHHRIAERRLTPRRGSRDSKPFRGPSTLTAASTSSIPTWDGTSTSTAASSPVYQYSSPTFQEAQPPTEPPPRTQATPTAESATPIWVSPSGRPALNSITPAQLRLTRRRAPQRRGSAPAGSAWIGPIVLNTHFTVSHRFLRAA